MGAFLDGSLSSATLVKYSIHTTVQNSTVTVIVLLVAGDFRYKTVLIYTLLNTTFGHDDRVTAIVVDFVHETRNIISKVLASYSGAQTSCVSGKSH